MEHVSRPQSVVSLIASAFVLSAAVLFGAFLMPSAVHAAAPNGFTSQVFQDSNGDGTIDQLTVVINGGEALTSCTVTAGELSTDWTLSGGGYGPTTLSSATCNTGTATITFVVGSATAGITGGVTAPTLAYNNSDADNSIANASGNLGTVGAQTLTDAAAPQIKTFTYQDVDTDGKIDTILITYTESTNASSVLKALHLSLTGVGDFTGAAFGAATSDVADGGTTDTVTLGTEASAEDTNSGSLTISSITGDGTMSITDGTNANTSAKAQSQASFVDGAGPVLISASPTNLQSGIRETANITLTYSETPASWTGSITGGISLSSSINSSVVTVSHTAHLLAGQNTLTLSTAPDSAANAFAGAQSGDSTVASPLVFTVTSSNSSNDSSSSTTEETYSIDVLTPEDGDVLEAGDAAEITWSSEGTGASYVNLYYSVDGGDAWETIVTNSLNDGSYMWTLPSVDSDEVMVKIVSTDLADELASDTSSTFSISMPSGSADDEDAGVDNSDEEVVEDVPSEIDGVMAGDYVMAEGGSTIYYVDSSMKIRPFPNEQTYFTYEPDFTPVVTLDASDLADFSIGAPMLPKAGVVLVKIQSVAKVYMVEETADGSYELRWITSEGVAEDMFGSSWSSYVVDVDVTLFMRYEEGGDVDSAEDVDTGDMKYRTELHD